MQYRTCLVCVCVFLASCNFDSGEAKVKGRWYTPSQVQSGEKIYEEYCVECHKEQAQGTASWKERDQDGFYPPPPLNGTAHAWHHPMSILKKTIDEGGIPLGGKMPGFKDKLNEERKLAVISYFQNFWSDEIYKSWVSRGGLN